MKAIGVGVVLTLSVVVAAGGAGATRQATQSLNGRLAFVAANGIASINPDGSGVWGITLAPGDTEPSWSPDGARLAISGRRGGDSDIYTLDPNGTRVVQLTFSPFEERQPAWSPDGTRIAYSSLDSIWVAPADGTGGRRLTVGRSDQSPAWSPDGSQIAFSRSANGNQDVWLMQADGSGQRRLTTAATFEQRPSWSPDGSRIAFEAYRDGEADIYSVRADGTDERRLTTSASSDSYPHWSPDGRRIAFVSDRAGKAAPQIHVMNADGSGQRQVTRGGASTAPAWQPLPPPPSFCDLWGTAGNDVLVGGARDDRLCGLAGHDTLIGLGGQDLLQGGEGRDWIAGGPGLDLLQGDSGIDRLDARDGSGDLVYGGGDGDLAFVDPGRVDLVRGFATVRHDRNIAAWRPVHAPSSESTNPPERAVDSRHDSSWTSAGSPRWIQIDLGRPSAIAGLRLVAAHHGDGTVHRVFGRGPATGGTLRLLWTFRGATLIRDVLVASPARPWRGIRHLRIETAVASSPGSWAEIEVLAPARR